MSPIASSKLLLLVGPDWKLIFFFLLCVSADSVVVLDPLGASDASLQLAANNIPVVSAYQISSLFLFRCGDSSCATVVQQQVDPTPDDVGKYPSLQLDASGYPVISYYDVTNEILKLVHCNDVICDGVGEIFQIVDGGAGRVGLHTSLQLDSSGFPVIAYHDNTALDLKLAHCGDINCAVLASITINVVDDTGAVGLYPSLQLDSLGFPVISYYASTGQDLKLAHCNDADCAGGGESIVVVESVNEVGLDSSLQLDSNGYPVISYHDNTALTLKLAHCIDANCANGGQSISIVVVDSVGQTGFDTSLQLDLFGFPVVSYFDTQTDDLKLVHCSDANCNTPVTPSTIDAGEVTSDYTSLQLNSDGVPVIAYNNASALILAICVGPNCDGIFAPTSTPTQQPTTAPTLQPSSNPTMTPSMVPTVAPTQAPTQVPTIGPTMTPTQIPTQGPTMAPTRTPTQGPTMIPTRTPTQGPTMSPSRLPTMTPSRMPTQRPTAAPTALPGSPTLAPTTRMPTAAPTGAQTHAVTLSPVIVGSTVITGDVVIADSVDVTQGSLSVLGNISFTSGSVLTVGAESSVNASSNVQLGGSLSVVLAEKPSRTGTPVVIQVISGSSLSGTFSSVDAAVASGLESCEKLIATEQQTGVSFSVSVSLDVGGCGLPLGAIIGIGLAGAAIVVALVIILYKVMKARRAMYDVSANAELRAKEIAMVKQGV